MTGSSELNHSETLNSGAIQAQESLELFPRELKVVSLYLALTAQRSSFNLVVNDVYLFMKDRYFVGEVLQACLEGKSWSNCTILQVREPSEQEVEDYNKIAVVNLTDEHKLFPPACLYKYRVQKFCSYNDINHVFEASASHVRRKKRLITKEKLRQFLKSCLVLDSRGIWVVQEPVVQNFCIHSLKFSDIFVGCPPKFPARYEKIAKKVKKNSSKNPLDPSVRGGGKKMKVATKSPRRDKNSSMSSNDDLNDFKNVVLNHSTESLNSVVPCKVLVRKLSESDGSRKIIKKVKKKYVKPEGEKENLNQVARKKYTTWRGMTLEERQKLKETKAKRALLDKLKRKEEKLKLKEKLKEEKLKMALMLKDHNRLREDLECEDLKPLPIPHVVNCSRIPNELFGDFVFIVEFFHCFRNIVNTKHVFPRGIKYEFLEEALTENNLNGMLTKITIFLLKELNKIREEDNEPVECDIGPLDVNDETGDISATDAIRLVAAEYGGQLYNGAFANEVVLNHLTVTEVLRLHFLSCGGRRWDPNSSRMSSVDPGDPVTVLRTQLPHLLENMCHFHLCELSMKEKIAILNCLVDEILACPPLGEELDKRGEELKQKKIELRAQKAAEVKKAREAEAQRIKEKKEAGLKLKQQYNAVVIPEPNPEEFKTELFDKELRSNRKKDFKEMHEELRTLAMNFHLCPIGIDRAHRRFWVFSSIPGLFVEQKAFEVGPCLLQPTPREPLSPRSGGKASSRKNSPHKSPKKEARCASYDACQSSTSEPVRTESWVCSSSGDCRIHEQSLTSSKWSYFQREEEVTLLLENLNKRGLRENELRKILLKEEHWVKESVSKCPLTFIDPSLIAETNQDSTSKVSVVEEHPDDSIGSMLQIILRDRILDLENQIAAGCLGSLEVKDLQEWREAIVNGGYDMQCDQLTWGMYTDPKEKDGTESSDSTEKNIIGSNYLLNGVQVINGEFVITKQSLQALLEISSTTNDSTVTSIHVLEEKNGQNLRMSPRKSVEHKTVENADEALSRNKMICIVRGLSCAILQLEQSIELKYIKKPLVEENDSEDDKLYQLKRWEASLMTATSISQLFLHLHILDSSICWSKSVVNTRCVACRRRGDAEKMLLCDGCNRGTHLFCLKPKLTQVPDGDWYCPKCEPEFKKDNSVRKRKSANGEVANKDSERRSSKSRRMTHNDVCEACGLRYNLILCSSCPTAFHLECLVPPLKELPEDLWTCPECDAEAGEVEEKENETSSSRRSSRRKSAPTDLLLNNSLLHDLLSDLMCHRDSWPFLQPVRKADAPRYHIIIKKPMDFGTMKYKLNRAHYKHNSEFIDDALLVFANCRMYNENDGVVYKCGARLSEYFKKRCKDMGFHCRD